MAELKRGRKKDGPRTEVFALRLDPKLKYLAEIAARKQRRSLANFVEWAIEQALSKVALHEWDDINGHREVVISDEASKLWDLEPSDRFLKLAENYPDLLTYEEQVIWKAIHEISTVSSYKGEDGKTHYTSHRFLQGEGNSRTPEPISIRECWATLVDYSLGNVSEKEVKEALSNSIPF